MEPPSRLETADFLKAAELLAAIFAEAGICESHGIGHALDVARRTDAALLCHPELPAEDAEDADYAALLHDGDDRKSFAGNSGHQNARAVLSAIGLPPARVERIVRMISWVSASANGDAVPPEAAENPWMLYPRHADRIASMGWTGVYRCWKYNRGIARPLYTADTPRAADEDDLWARVATPARYAAYRGESASMLDHYYDKLLHVGRVPIDNAFLQAECQRRSRPLVEVALLFGRTGSLPDDLFERARAAAEKESA